MTGGGRRALPAAAAALLLGACGGAGEAPGSGAAGPGCAADNAGLSLPPGFCARVVAEHFAHLRHLAVSSRGDIYAAQRNRRLGFGGVVALRDSDGDGSADRIESFGSEGVTGLAFHRGHLYAGEDERIVRWSMQDGDLVPAAAPEVVVDGLPAAEYHGAKAFAFDGAGALYVNVGAPSNACQVRDREAGSPGMDPCPQLETGGGIWRFAAERPGQVFGRDGERFASGIRHALALAWHGDSGTLFAAQHGRDALAASWPELYSPREDDALPAEEVLVVRPGAAYAWPYCYYDGRRGAYVLAPEYGGDGRRQGRCADYPEPYATLPAHAGPNDMLVYEGSAFPARYRDGLFIALHGAWLAHAGKAAGYSLAFLPGPAAPGDWQVFAGGFAGAAAATPAHRPTGLAVGPEGALYVADSVAGRIYRIAYTGR